MKKILSVLLAALLLVSPWMQPTAAAEEPQPAEKSYHFSYAYGCLFAIDEEGTVRLASSQQTGWPLESNAEPALGWTDIVEISGTDGVTAALRRDGTVVSHFYWQDHSEEVAAWTDVVQIVTAYSGVIGLRRDGTVAAAGSDWLGIEGGYYDFSGWTDVERLVSACCAAGYTVIGLRSDGTLLDTNDEPEEIEPGLAYMYRWSGPAEHVTDVISSGWIEVALKEDGTVICKGIDALSSLVDKVTAWRDIAGIAIAGESCVVGLRSDGTVCMANLYDDTALLPEEGWHDITEIRASEAYLVGLRGDGTVKAWSYQGAHDEQVREIESWQDLERIFVAEDMVVGWKTDGSIVSISFNPAELP